MSLKHATENRKSNWLQGLFNRHHHASKLSFLHFLKSPLANFLTLMVIALALALPTGLIVMLQNAQTVSENWDVGSRISLFLNTNVTPEQAKALMGKLRVNSKIAYVNYISPEQGLKEFQQRSGFSDIMAQLNKNPLPGVIEIEPVKNLQSTDDINQLVTQLKQFPEVNTVQMDMAWVKRLFGIMNLAKHAIYALGMLLALAVLLIIGNTIRLIIQNRAEEIEVIKLVGGTDRFIRRPFLYTGVIYGFLGGLISWVLVDLFLLSLRGPVHHLAQLYASHFQLDGLSWGAVITLLILSTILGLVGSFIAVGRQLHAIEPS